MNPKHRVERHYCSSCEKNHSLTIDSWTWWRTAKHGNKTLHYCNKGMDCVGCAKIHPRTPVITHVKRQHPKTGEVLDGWWCNKWVRESRRVKRLEDYSPQEIVSGVDLGNERQEIWGDDTEDHSVVHARQMREFNKALEEVER